MKYFILLWANWGKNIISMLMYEKEVQPLQNVLYVNIWKTWYPKLEKIMLVPRSMNWNWKGITIIKNCVDVFTIVRKQSPFNQRKSFCVSFTRRMVMRGLFNIQMNCGPMTIISQLDIFCVYYKLWGRNLFVSHKGYLIMNYKMNYLRN